MSDVREIFVDSEPPPCGGSLPRNEDALYRLHSLIELIERGKAVGKIVSIPFSRDIHLLHESWMGP